MKRLIIMGLVALTATVTAQDNPRLRTRWGQALQAGAAVPRVTITGPTLGEDWTVEGDSLDLSGLAESTSASPIATVTWECATCDPTSGTMTHGTGGVVPWQSAGGAGSATVLQDTFTGSTAQLKLLTPVVGGQWTEAANTTSPVDTYYINRNVGGWAQINSTTANGVRIVMIGAPAPAITGTNYDISNTLQAVDSADGDDGFAVAIFGWQDTNNFCATLIYGAGAATDAYLLKWSGGVLQAPLDTANINPALNDVILTEVRSGTNISVKVNDVEQMSAAGAACTAGTGVGWGLGSFRNVAADDASSRWHADDFTVVDQDASSGAITLSPGQNTITVEACDELDVCGVDFIRVTSEVADTVDPEVTITEPTASLTYPTSTEALPAVTGTVTDNVAAVSCTLTSATTDPTSRVCTLTGTGTDKTFSCATVDLAPDDNTITVTCEDAEANDHADSFVADYTVGDITAPVVTITTNGGSGVGVSFSTTSSTGTIAGTCTDAVGCTQILASCDVCSVGTVSGGLGVSGQWSFLGTWTVGANIISVGARDEANNQMNPKDTITVTYNPGVLTLASKSFGNGRVGEAYLATNIQASGGTSPYTYGNNGAGATLNNADAQCAGLSVNTAGLVSGTPTTEGVCTWTGSVSDGAAGSDTEPYSITIVAAGAAGPHDYFTALLARGDCFRAFSFRPNALQTTPVGTTVGVADCTHSDWSGQLTTSGTGTHTNVSYAPGSDTDPQKQDAAKFRIPVWGLNPQGTLASDIDGTSDPVVVTFNSPALPGDNGASYLIDSEIVTATSNSGATMTVSRGRFNTTKAAHTAGASIYRSNNTLPQPIKRAMQTDGQVSARYLYTWDYYPTGSYVGTGLTNHKAFQIGSKDSGTQFWETDTKFQGDHSCCPSGFVLGTDVSPIHARPYWQSLMQTADQPGQPMQGTPFVMKPNRWTRFWVLVEANAETDATKFIPATVLSSAVTDTETTLVSITHPTTTTTHPFTFMPYQAERRIRIDSEIMTIISGEPASTAGAVRTLTVIRGVGPTTKTTHALGATVEVIEDYITMWVADENTEPAMMYDNFSGYIPHNGSTAVTRGGLQGFWIELNTSTQQLTQGRANGPDGNINATADNFSDLVSYFRGLVLLKDPPADWSSLRVKPVR